MPTIDIIVPKLHTAQREIYYHPARFKVVVCGRRFGKTALAVRESVHHLSHGNSCAYFSVTHKNVKEFWARITDTVKPITEKINNSDLTLQSIGGGILECWSTHNLSAESARGRKYHHVIIDEAALIPTLEVWEKIILAMLTDYSGSAGFYTTPRGFNWIYDLYMMGKTDEHPDWQAFHYPTHSNPHISKKELTLIKSMVSEGTWNQEYLAQFTKGSGVIYDQFDQIIHVTTNAEYNPNLPVYWGVDDGYVYGEGKGTASYHPRVIVFAQKTAQGGLNVFSEYVECGEVAEKAIENVLELPYPNPDTAYVDSSAAELKARLWDKGIQTVGGTHRVDEGIKNMQRMLRNALGQSLIQIHPRCVETIHEFQSYRWKEPPASGGDPKPQKLDDHCMDAIRYVAWSLRFG